MNQEKSEVPKTEVQEDKKQVSKLAILSFSLGLFTWLFPSIFFWLIITINETMSEGVFRRHEPILRLLTYLLSPIMGIISIVCGIISHRHIKQSKLVLLGNNYAISGILLSAFYFINLIVVETIGYLKLGHIVLWEILLPILAVVAIPIIIIYSCLNYIKLRFNKRF